MSDKIKVSWDEISSTSTDKKIKQQELFNRAGQHYGQQTIGAIKQQAIQGSGAAGHGLIYNSVFYMAIFGLLGGLFAWIAGEVVYKNYGQSSDFYREWNRTYYSYIQSKNEFAFEQARAEFKPIREKYTTGKYSGNPYIKLYIESIDMWFGGRLTEEDELRISDEVKKLSNKDSLLFFMFCGLFLGLFISAAEPAVARNWRSLAIAGSIGAMLGLIGGLIVGLPWSDKLYAALGAGSQNFGVQMFARSLIWGIVGIFLAAGPGVAMRSIKRLLIGLAGGFVGGVVGGLLFDPISLVTESGVQSRLVQLVAIGVVTGIGTCLIEKAAKSGWLRVLSGMIAGKQFVLYKNPTAIGSSPQCEIYLFKDTQVAPRHALIHVVPGGFEIEDASGTGTLLINGSPTRRKRLSNGETIQIGSTVFCFEEKAKPRPVVAGLS